MTTKLEQSGVMSRAQMAIVSGVCLLVFLVAGLNDSAAVTAVGQEPAWLARGARFITLFGSSGYMLLASAVLALAAVLARRTGLDRLFGLAPHLLTERAVFFFVAVAGSGLLAQALKHIVGRARPKLISEVGAYHFDALNWKASLASFPSGHAVTAFAAATALSLFLPRARLALFAFAILIALSRVLVGAHFPSDVVAGAALGTLVALWMARLFGRRGIALEATDSTLSVKPGAGPLIVAEPDRVS